MSRSRVIQDDHEQKPCNPGFSLKLSHSRPHTSEAHYNLLTVNTPLNDFLNSQQLHDLPTLQVHIINTASKRTAVSDTDFDNAPYEAQNKLALEQNNRIISGGNNLLQITT